MFPILQGVSTIIWLVVGLFSLFSIDRHVSAHPGAPMMTALPIGHWMIQVVIAFAAWHLYRWAGEKQKEAAAPADGKPATNMNKAGKFATQEALLDLIDSEAFTKAVAEKGTPAKAYLVFPDGSQIKKQIGCEVSPPPDMPAAKSIAAIVPVAEASAV